MELYSDSSFELSERLTKRYSTSFSMSSRLFDASIRKYIYAIYGLVRIADEIVDSFRAQSAASDLEALRQEVFAAIERGYSVNPIVHSFAVTANLYKIGPDLINPFFDSMALDLQSVRLDADSYKAYIHGSAEVVGLMCLKVFTAGDQSTYDSLALGARALGSAYQKVNFLRDMKADYEELGRVYFPSVDFNEFSEADKNSIVDDIEADFAASLQATNKLPANSRKAVKASYDYYYELLAKLKASSVSDIKSKRIRVSDTRKLTLLMKAYVA